MSFAKCCKSIPYYSILLATCTIAAVIYCNHYVRESISQTLNLTQQSSLANSIAQVCALTMLLIRFL